MRLGLGKPLRRPALVVVLPLVLIGLAGTAVAISDRSADSLFVARQQNLSAIQPAAVAHLISLAPDPKPGLGRPRALSANCSAKGIGELRNPWSCRVLYVHGASVQYQVTISPSGSLSGVDPTGQLVVHGCCVGPRSSAQ